MKMNEIIRKRRKEMELTQEQVANYLGVTTPAVNKWERGNTYPDIMLLPALAKACASEGLTYRLADSVYFPSLLPSAPTARTL